MLSRSDEIFPLWDPERNDEAVLRPGYRPTCMVGDERRNRLAKYGVNTIQGVRSAARSGPRPRTLAAGNAGSADWQYLSARRLALFIVNCIERGTRWTATALPSKDMAELVATQVRVFFEGLFVAGAFGSRRVDDAFFVVCDERANSKGRSSGDFQFLVGFAAARNNDYHSFRITHGMLGTTIQPVSLNRWNFASYSPAELEWVDNIARQLNG
jgi:phage tail sheath protein FI